MDKSSLKQNYGLNIKIISFKNKYGMKRRIERRRRKRRRRKRRRERRMERRMEGGQWISV